MLDGVRVDVFIVSANAHFHLHDDIKLSHLGSFVILTMSNQYDVLSHSLLTDVPVSLGLRHWLWIIFILHLSLSYLGSDWWRTTAIPIMVPQGILESRPPKLPSWKETMVLP